MVLAWHFLSSEGKLRDGRDAPPDGEWLRHEETIQMCFAGLHASEQVSDALNYAPGSIVCRVECRGDIEQRTDKLVCRERRILWRADATEALQDHARWCAYQVVSIWDAPDVVVKYLRTGDKSLRAEARVAASKGARDESWDVVNAWAAAWAAVAPSSSSWGATRTAARIAAKSAVRATARATSWDAAIKAQCLDLSRRISALESL